jgi:hypothetical protein
MSARVDLVVKKHLDAMHRQQLRREAAGLSARANTRLFGRDESRPFGASEIEDDFDQEEILQPRRLSLRVF